MPQSAEERIDHARRMVDKALALDLPLSDLYIDPLIFPISVDAQFGHHAFDAIRQLRGELGADIHITGGFSNVSFGLPCRHLINDAFLLLAVEAGADSAIMDPTTTFLADLFAIESPSPPLPISRGYVARPRRVLRRLPSRLSQGRTCRLARWSLLVLSSRLKPSLGRQIFFAEVCRLRTEKEGRYAEKQNLYLCCSAIVDPRRLRRNIPYRVRRRFKQDHTVHTLGGQRPALLVLPTDHDPRDAYSARAQPARASPAIRLSHDRYFGLSQRVNDDRFALIMANGTRDPDGNRFWNATDFCCDLHNTQVDDVQYLSGLLEEAATHIAVSTSSPSGIPTAALCPTASPVKTSQG